jgi:hypothetical protein
MRNWRWTLLLAVGLSSGVTASTTTNGESTQRPRLFVNDLTPLRTSVEEAQAFTDAIVSYLANQGVFEIISSREVQTLVGAERQKQLLGLCASDEAQCAQDVTSLLAARFILTGQLARVGSAFQLTLQMSDTTRAVVLSRSTKLSTRQENLRELIPWIAAEATGSPLPPPPSKLLPISLMVAGGVAALAGGVVGLLALSSEQQLNNELCPGGPASDGRCSGVNLRDRSFYSGQDDALAVQKGLGLGILAAGVVLAGVGYWLLPPDDVRMRITAVVTPSTGGFAVSGGF